MREEFQAWAADVAIAGGRQRHRERSDISKGRKYHLHSHKECWECVITTCGCGLCRMEMIVDLLMSRFRAKTMPCSTAHYHDRDNQLGHGCQRQRSGKNLWMYAEFKQVCSYKWRDWTGNGMKWGGSSPLFYYATSTPHESRPFGPLER